MEKQKNKLEILGLALAIIAMLCMCASSKFALFLAFIALVINFKAKTDDKHLTASNAFGIGISVLAVIFGLISVTSGADNKKKADEVVSNVASTEKEYATDAINVISSNPDNYKGKYVTFDGCNVNIIEEDNDSIYYQIYTDLDRNTSVLVEVPKSICADKVTSDYVTVNGQIQGSKVGKTVVGVHTSWAYIIADSITPSDYINTFGKADTTWNYSDKIISQHDVSVQVTQVDFNSTETRVYVTVTNNSSNKFNIYDYNAKIVQNGQQYDVTYNYNADYEKLSSDILSGASTSGIIVFPPLSASDMQLQIEGSSDDWNIDFEPFAFDLTAQ